MAGGHGGRRPGAGRKSGLLWRGSDAVSAQSRAQVAALAREHDADPRGFLASVMNDQKVDLQTRLSAATALMPFCYPKLSAQAVVSTRIEAVEPGALIRTINERLARITEPQQHGGGIVRQIDAETPSSPPKYEGHSAAAHAAAHMPTAGGAP